jgi:outer membrane protein OmpA-like peptidoglycan-associated protein
MSFNVLTTVKSLFSDEIISKASSTLAESETSISKAISGIVPSILGGITSKASSGEYGAETISQLAKTAAANGAISDLANTFNGSTAALSNGWEILKTIFGDKLNSITSAVAKHSDIQESSSASLMSMVAPVTLSVIGQHAQQTNLASGSLAGWLASQKNIIINSIPNGLGGSLKGLLGLSSIGTSAKSGASFSSYTTEDDEKTGNDMKFLLPLFLAILVVILLIYFFKGYNEGAKEAITNKDTEVTKNAIAAPISIKVTLPNGVELNAYKAGIEDQLVTFLMTDYTKLSEDSLKAKWFDFDNLNFKSNSAEITAGSQHQINNIASILRAFPKSKIKIGGYTDKTGNEELNKKLSGERAAAVRTALGKAAVGAQVIAAEGYGSDFAKYHADASESDRIKDRHVSISVRS